MAATIHPSAIVDEGAQIGEGSRVWHFVHVCAGADIDIVADARRIFVGLGRIDEEGGAADMGAHVDAAVLADARGGIDHQQPVMDDGDAGPEDVEPQAEAEANRQAPEPEQEGRPDEEGLAAVVQIFAEPHQQRKARDGVKQEGPDRARNAHAREVGAHIGVATRPTVDQVHPPLRCSSARLGNGAANCQRLATGGEGAWRIIGEPLSARPMQEFRRPRETGARAGLGGMRTWK